MKKINKFKEYENCTEGNLKFSVYDASDGWEKSGAIHMFGDVVYAVVNDIAKDYPSIVVLRGIIITSNVLSTYNKIIEDSSDFQEMIEPIEGNLVIGKAVTWGQIDINNIDKYHGIIILHENICAGVMEGNLTCYSILLHELTHVAENFTADYYLGKSESHLVGLWEWEKLKFEYARILLSEYIAQKMATNYLEGDPASLDETLLSSLQYLKSTNELIDSWIMTYQQDNDIDKLWYNATSIQQRTLNIISGSIGLIDGLNRELQGKIWSEFSKVGDARWEAVFNELRHGLQNVDKVYSKESFRHLIKAIEYSFNNYGIYPVYGKNGKLKITLK